jgi:hypothetical protein
LALSSGFPFGFDALSRGLELGPVVELPAAVTVGVPEAEPDEFFGVFLAGAEHAEDVSGDVSVGEV